MQPATGAAMAPNNDDKDTKRVNPGINRGASPEVTRDEIGPRQPRWAEPRPKTTIAVALDYKKPDGKVDPKRAPRVSASGRGAVAEQILQIAFAKGIPVREDADLAQILSTVDIDSVIPVDALSAVAEILSYLYRMNGKAMDGDLTPETDAGADETGDRG
jgi:flagellar biosynthesis protein